MGGHNAARKTRQAVQLAARRFHEEKNETQATKSPSSGEGTPGLDRTQTDAQKQAREEYLRRREESRRKWSVEADDWTPLQPGEEPAQAPEPTVREAPATANKESLAHAKSKGWYDDVGPEFDNIRTGVGSPGQVSLSPEVKDLVKGQPLSEMIYRLSAQPPKSNAEREKDMRDKLAVDYQNRMLRLREELKKDGSTPDEINQAIQEKKKYFDFDSLIRQFDSGTKIIKDPVTKKAFDSLSRPEKAALVYYTHNGDEVMNGHLRAIMGHMEKWHRAKDPIEKDRLGQIISKHLAKKEVQQTSQLVQLTMDALAKLPQHRGTVYRGAGKFDVARMKQGDVFYRPGFMSTTKGEAREVFWDEEHPGQMAIMSDRGVDVSMISWYPEEDEVLRPPGMLHWIDVRTPGLVFTPEDVEIEPIANDKAKTFLGLVQVDGDHKPLKPQADDKKPGDGVPMKEYHMDNPERAKHIGHRMSKPSQNDLEKSINRVLRGLADDAKEGAKQAMAKDKPKKLTPQNPAI